MINFCRMHGCVSRTKLSDGCFGWLLALKVVEIGLLLALHYVFDFDWLEACAITAAVAIGLAVIVWSIGKARS